MRCRRCRFEGVILYEFVDLGWFWDGSHFSACPECGREHKINLPLLVPEFLRLSRWKRSHPHIVSYGPRKITRPEINKALDYFTLRHLEWEQARPPRYFSPDDCRYNDALNEFFFFSSARQGEDVPRLPPSSQTPLPRGTYFPDNPPDDRYTAWKQAQVAERIAKTAGFLADLKRNLSEPFNNELDPDFMLFVPDMYPYFYETLIASGENLDQPTNKRETLRLRMVDMIFPQREIVQDTGLEIREIHCQLAQKVRRDWFQVWDEE